MRSALSGRGAAVVVLLTAWLAAPVPLHAQNLTARFTATATNLQPGDGVPVRLDVIRWSTDAEREALMKAFGEGQEAFVAALKESPSLGYVWTNEGPGYFIRYAVRLPQDAGGERIVIATDRQVGSWGFQPWRPAGAASAQDYPFSVIELRVGAEGGGEGKMSLAAPVAADGDTLALDRWGSAPVLLRDVRKAS